MFEKLKSIYPLPKGWDGDDDRRKFGIRIQELFEWVQKVITSIKTNISTLSTQIANKVDKSAIKNNHSTTDAGYVLDARQGKSLSDMIENRVVGGRVTKNVTGSSSQQTVRIDLTNGYWFMIISVPGLSRVWVGVVQCATDGTVNIATIKEASALVIETGSYKLNCKFTYSFDTTIQFEAIPIRGTNMPTFH